MLIGLLKTILYILFFYYLFKILARIFFPIVMKKTMDNMEDKYRKYQEQQSGYQQGKEGETVIDKKPNAKRKNKSVKGEYIDYEEIE
jgi:uncharacterized membrane-anchored protein YitT (DUF2179 family)